MDYVGSTTHRLKQRSIFQRFSNSACTNKKPGFAGLFGLMPLIADDQTSSREYQRLGKYHHNRVTQTNVIQFRHLNAAHRMHTAASVLDHHVTVPIHCFDGATSEPAAQRRRRSFQRHLQVAHFTHNDPGVSLFLCGRRAHFGLDEAT